MRRICISKDWYLSAPGTNGYQPVDLPNDYIITCERDPHSPGGASNGFYPGGEGKYVKYLTFDERPCHRILDIDGGYMNTEIRFNDNLLAIHPYGYTPFLVDLTEKQRPGHINKLKIVTNPALPSTRWYAGGGLYRDVFLWEGGDIRIEPWDLFASTAAVSDGTATLSLSCIVTADRAADVTVVYTLLDRDGRPAATLRTPLSLAAGKNPTAATLRVENAHLWDTDDPYCYTLRAVVEEKNAVCDTAEVVAGIRTVSFDTEHGFRLNGVTRKLRGGCIHHDHGALGAAAYPAAEERKIRILQKAGFNAVRIAHNPPSLALLEVCDRLGMLVMDEAFDMWNEQKNPCDYHLYFADWYARDIAYMVLRDRNHPCVISYSIGNEIHERSGFSDGALWARRLTDEVKKHDTTRPVTSALCCTWDRFDPMDPPEYRTDFLRGFPDAGNGNPDSSWDKLTEDYMKPLDIVGYNYLYFRYRQDHENYPDRIIWGSETQTLHFYDSWKETLACSHVLGDFTWTAYDNLGEAGAGRLQWGNGPLRGELVTTGFAWRSCYQGDHDLCGFRRPQSYFREAVFVGNTEPRIFTTHPAHYGESYTGTGWHWPEVLDSWTFDAAWIGKPVRCEVYTDADEIRFFLNDRPVGTAVPEKAVAACDIPYEPGTLTAVAFRDGRECGRSSLRTVGAAHAVRVTPEKPAFAADRRDLAYFDIVIVDANGDRVPDAKNELNAVVDGGELLCIFSGDPCSPDRYGTARCHAFAGRALAVIRTADPGRVTLTVGGPGLRAGEATVDAEQP